MNEPREGKLDEYGWDRDDATAVLCDGKIVIRLSLDALKSVAEGHDNLTSFDDEGKMMPPIVTDIDLFARDVLDVLRQEEDDGTTHVHRLFDYAIEEAVSQGAEGIRVALDGEYLDE